MLSAWRLGPSGFAQVAGRPQPEALVPGTLYVVMGVLIHSGRCPLVCHLGFACRRAFPRSPTLLMLDKWRDDG